MNNPSRKNQELLEENALLKQRIQELEHSESDRKQVQSQWEAALEAVRENDIHKAPFFNKKGEISGTVGSGRDITEIKYAEGALQASQQIIEGIINAIAVRVFWKDRNLVFLGCNTLFARDAGFTDPKDIIGKDDYQMVWRDQAELYRSDDRQIIESGSSKLCIEEPQKTPDGNIITLLTNKVPLRSSKGEITGVLGTYIDITERKQADEILRRSEEKFRFLTENMNDTIFTMDLSLQTTYISQSIKKILGFTPEERMKQHATEQVIPASMTLIGEILSEELKREQEGSGDPDRSVKFEVGYYHKDGSTVWMENVISGIRDDQGILVGIQGVSRDITDRKRAEEELGINRNRLSRAEIISRSGNWEFDMGSNRVSGSDGARNIYGLLNTEWTITEVQKIPLPEYRDMLDRAIQELIKEDRPYDVEFKIQRPDTGETVDIHSVAEYDRHRNIVFGIIQDITEYKRAEEGLRETQRRLVDIIEFLPDATLVIDRDGKVMAWNRAIESMTGIRAEEMLGKGNYEYSLPFYGDRRPILIDLALHPDLEKEKAYTSIHRTGDIIIGEAYTPALAPGNVHLSATSSVLRNSRGDIIAAIECIRNNTDRKSMEERLKRGEKMESLGVLAGGVAHDMNNVLGVLVGYSELLLREVPEGSRAGKYAKSILQGGERAAAIIQDLLTMARRGVSVSETVNMNRIVADSFKTPEFELVKSHHPEVLFRSQVEKDLFNVKGSPVHLSKTIMNLLSNAAESISGAGEVSITTENRYVDVPIPGYENTQEGEYVVLTISDTGSGISSADMGRIFEPFYTKKVMGRSGTGLGLAVVWGTVKDHGGYIDVRSEENTGSTFTLYFPASREALSKRDQDLFPDSYQGRGESILVVDDIEEQRLLAATILEDLNYRVATAASGENAVEYLRANKADLIVLDMIMEPGIDGLETYRRILEIRPQQKAIIVSGFAKTDRVRAAQELGAGEYVKKPYVIGKIGITIRKELDRR